MPSARRFRSLDDRGPLRVMFVITSMPVGGAETLLVNLIRRLNRERFAPELCCLKELGPLGTVLANEIPAHTGLLSGKYDVKVLPRLVRLLRKRRIDAVVTVGAGDKMFWGRLAGRIAGVPVIAAALHSTGWPDCIGRLNRMLTRLTGAFIGVAPEHGRYLVETEGFPAEKVHVIPNGVDCQRFAPRTASDALRAEFDLPSGAPVAGIVAALRPEKNHELFLQMAQLVQKQVPEAKFIVVGEGERRAELEQLTRELDLTAAVRFVGNRSDIPAVLSLCDLFVLTSHMEANPVSILEAMACGKPVVATNVGSVAGSVRPGETGFLAPAGDAAALASHVAYLMLHPAVARELGATGRNRVVGNWSLERMVAGYEELLQRLYAQRCGGTVPSQQPALPAADAASRC